MDNDSRGDGKEVLADGDPVKNLSFSVDNRVEVNGDLSDGKGKFDFAESRASCPTETILDSKEIRNDFNPDLVNRVEDFRIVQSALGHTPGMVSVGANGSSSREGADRENLSSSKTDGASTGFKKMVEAELKGIRSYEIPGVVTGVGDESSTSVKQSNDQAPENAQPFEESNSSTHDPSSNRKGTESENQVELSPKLTASPSGASTGSPTTKGYGLKKWRRIRRDAVKDAGIEHDPNRILKRGLPSFEAVKGSGSSRENKQVSEGSAGSVTSSAKNVGTSGLPLGISDSESRLAMGSTFPLRTESENSVDRSSKSSTATSTVKLRPEVPIVIGFTKEKSKPKNLSGRVSANATQKGQQGRTKVEASKKLRGERAKIESENSYSSVESDLKSSRFVFSQMGNVAEVANGMEKGRPFNGDAENNDEGHTSDRQSSEEARTDYHKDNREESTEVASEDWAPNAPRTKSEENRTGPHAVKDPLVESISLLQAAQEALEKEIQKFSEIGKESLLSLDGASRDISLSSKFATGNASADEPSSSAQQRSEEMEESSSTPMETRINELNQKVNLLEFSLDESKEALKAKESKLLELESLLSLTQKPKAKYENDRVSSNEIFERMESEVEDLFLKKMEAEIEYLTVVETTQNLISAVENRVVLFKEQKALVEERAELLHKLQDASCKASLLEGEAKKLEASSRELINIEEVLMARNNLCKYALICFFQILMFCIVLGWFLLQLFPPSTGVVPT